MADCRDRGPAARAEGAPRWWLTSTHTPPPAGISLTGLTKTFRSPQGPVHAVRDLDLAIHPGQTVALLGPNGAGKSTTVDPDLAAATLAGGVSPPTGRERDVLVAARGGATVADIARRLFLSEGTVRNYLSAAIARPASAIASKPCGWPTSGDGSSLPRRAQ
jgi:ABC-type transport system involved in cytochrome bd biosynthesis fused ATPase/permease subunit